MSRGETDDGRRRGEKIDSALWLGHRVFWIIRQLGHVKMVFPLTLDFQIAQSQSLLMKAQLFQQRQRRGVGGHDVGFYPVKAQRLKSQGQNPLQSFGNRIENSLD